MNQIHYQLCNVTGEKPHQKHSIYLILINQASITLESYCTKKQRNYLLTTLHLGIADIIRIFLPGFEKVHSCMTTCTTTPSSSQRQATATPRPALLNY